MDERAIGAVLGSAIGPGQLSGSARLVEDLGFDEIWLAEDFFFTGGVSGATIVLQSTERLAVGLGVVSALVRHPALLAMEIATLAKVFPDRLIPGIGLGVPAWMRQMDLMPRSPLTAMRECVTATRDLLRGEELTRNGEVFSFDRVRLSWAPEGEVPIHMGVVGPKMLQLSGEIADGSILSVAASHAYLDWTGGQVDAGRRRAGRDEPHRMTVFALYSVAEEGDEARRAVRGPLAFYKAAGGPNALTDVYGISDRLRDMIGRGGAEVIEAEMPDAWVEDLTISGDPAECAAKIRSFHERGADSVALYPMPSHRAAEVLELTGAEVLPRLG